MFGTHHFVQKIKNAQVEFMIFWWALIKILFYKDLCKITLHWSDVNITVSQVVRHTV
jgi:predicted membrane-bound mannosyltransferase